MTMTEAVCEFLRDPASYPNRPQPVEIIVTEGSWIALAGEYAYKVKRPIRFDAWDFTTLELREKACLREVRLNRRLGGDIYLDVIPIHSRDGVLSFHGPGQTVDFAIRMRRLPADRMMDRVLAGGGPDGGQIEALVDLLAEFYSSARSAGKVAKSGTRSFLDAAVRQNVKAVDDYLKTPDLLEPIECAQLLFLARSEDRLKHRLAMGKVRDGHGGLRTDHVCLVDPPIIIGCVEYRDRERTQDVISDLASLFVDLDLRGRSDVAKRIWSNLAEKLEENASDPLVDFYGACRAMASARIESLRPTQSDEVRQRCRQLVDLARAYTLRFHTPTMIATIGLIGAGKTTLANALAGEFGLRRISSEDIRAELFPPDASGKSSVNRLDIAQAETVYDRLLEKAREAMAQGISVVLDAGFFRRQFRENARNLARECGAMPLFLDCRLSRSDAIARLDQRFRKNRTKRMPKPEHYEEQIALFEEPNELPPDSVVILNMSKQVPDLVETVRESL